MYGILGVVNTILLIIPQQLITMFFLINFSLCGITAAFDFKRYKGYLNFKDFVAKSVSYYLISLVSILLDIILIFVIIRPFNLFV